MAKTIHLQVGETFNTSVENMAGGGYLWALVSEKANVTDTSLHTDAPGKHQAIGAASTQTIHIKGKAKGSSEVILALKRPWESGEDAIKELRFEVKVG
ncbi:hypothetical protein GCM10027051_19150 [Niabella terrae]